MVTFGPGLGWTQFLGPGVLLRAGEVGGGMFLALNRNLSPVLSIILTIDLPSLDADGEHKQKTHIIEKKHSRQTT